MAVVAKNPPANAEDVRDVAAVPGSGRSPGGGHGNPLQYSRLGLPWAEKPSGLHGITKSQTRLKRPSTHACGGGGRARGRNTAPGLRGK